MFLEDYIAENISDENFYDILDEYLDNHLPVNRDGALELMDAIKTYDLIMELYEKLLTDYEDFLTKEEYEEIKKEKAEAFDLSWEEAL